jgi:putative transcriptional regulator
VGIIPRFNKKLVSRIKELREEQKISQQDLAKSVGVSRQTIYYLERGMSNPSLTLSLDISKQLNEPIEEIFYYEPVIKELINDIKIGDIKEIANEIGIEYNKILKLSEIDDGQLSKMYTEEELIKISEALGKKFHELFLKDED